MVFCGYLNTLLTPEPVPPFINQLGRISSRYCYLLFNSWLGEYDILVPRYDGCPLVQWPLADDGLLSSIPSVADLVAAALLLWGLVYWIFTVVAIAMKSFDVFAAKGMPMAVLYAVTGAVVTAVWMPLAFLLLEVVCSMSAVIGSQDWKFDPLGSENSLCVTLYFCFTAIVMVAMIGMQQGTMWAWGLLRYAIDPQALDAPTVDVAGRLIVLTGGTSGLGLELAESLVCRGALVITSSIDSQEVLDAAEERVGAAAKAARMDGSFVVVPGLNLSNLQGVREWVKALQIVVGDATVDMFIANAGVIPSAGASVPYPAAGDDAVLDLAVAVNYLGHRVLYEELEPLLVKAATGTWTPRAVFVSSEGHRFSDNILGGEEALSEIIRSPSSQLSYPRSKMLLQTWLAALRPHAKAKGIVVNCVHPGSMATPIYQRSIPSFILPLFDHCTGVMLRTAWEGSFTVLHCALAKQALEASECEDGECPYYASMGGNLIGRYPAHPMTGNAYAQEVVELATVALLEATS